MASNTYALLEETEPCIVHLRFDRTKVALEAGWDATAEGIAGTSALGDVFVPWSQVDFVTGTL